MEEDDLKPSETQGFKVGDKKTVEELANLDKNDESLNRWKESLGISSGVKGAGGKNVIIRSMGMKVKGRPDIVFPLDSPDAIKKLENTPIIIKEGSEYNLFVTFQVSQSIVSGLKYLQVVKRKGIKVDKTEEMIGSYGPNEKPYTKEFPTEEAPSGLLARGTYEAVSRFIDDDKEVPAEWRWTFKIAKSWE